MTASLFSYPIVPLATVDDPEVVGAIGDGLVDGGLPIVEVALRGEHGERAIELLSARGDLLVGAGTVLSEVQARAAIDAGAAFLVSPGLSTDVLHAARDANVPYLPGTLTPSEVQAARSLGVRHVKVFPAGPFGGPRLLASYAQVFRDMGFMPSGGVSAEDVAEYLSSPAVFAVSGSWITARAHEGTARVATAARDAIAATGRS